MTSDERPVTDLWLFISLLPPKKNSLRWMN